MILAGGMLFTPMPDLLAGEGVSVVRAETLNGFQTFNGVTYYYVSGYASQVSELKKEATILVRKSSENTFR